MSFFTPFPLQNPQAVLDETKIANNQELLHGHLEVKYFQSISPIPYHREMKALSPPPVPAFASGTEARNAHRPQRTLQAPHPVQPRPPPPHHAHTGVARN